MVTLEEFLREYSWITDLINKRKLKTLISDINEFLKSDSRFQDYWSSLGLPIRRFVPKEAEELAKRLSIPKRASDYDKEFKDNFLKRWPFLKKYRLEDSLEYAKWNLEKKAGWFSRRKVNVLNERALSKRRKMDALNSQKLEDCLVELFNYFKSVNQQGAAVKVEETVVGLRTKMPIGVKDKIKFFKVKLYYLNSNKDERQKFIGYLIQNWEQVAKILYSIERIPGVVKNSPTGISSAYFLREENLFDFYKVGLLTPSDIKLWADIADSRNSNERKIKAEDFFKRRIIPEFQKLFQSFDLPLEEVLRAHGLDPRFNFGISSEFLWGPERITMSLKVIKELEIIRPGASFILYEHQGILTFFHYDIEILVNQFDNINSSAPYGVWLENRWEYRIFQPIARPPDYKRSNQKKIDLAFRSLSRQLKEHGYLIRIIECHDLADAYKRFLLLNKHYNLSGTNRIKFILVDGHSNEEGIVFGNENYDSFDREHLFGSELPNTAHDVIGKKIEHRIGLLRSLIEPDAQIFLLGCLSGEEGGIAQELSRAFKCKAIGPKFTAVEVIFKVVVKAGKLKIKVIHINNRLIYAFSKSYDKGN